MGIFNTIQDIFWTTSETPQILTPIQSGGTSKYKKTLQNKRITKQNKPKTIRKTRKNNRKYTKRSKYVI